MLQPDQLDDLAFKTESEKNEEIKRLKNLVRISYFALNTCRRYSVGNVSLQKFNSAAVRNAIRELEETAIEETVDNLDTFLNQRKLRGEKRTCS